MKNKKSNQVLNWLKEYYLFIITVMMYGLLLFNIDYFNGGFGLFLAFSLLRIDSLFPLFARIHFILFPLFLTILFFVKNNFREKKWAKVILYSSLVIFIILFFLFNLFVVIVKNGSGFEL